MRNHWKTALPFGDHRTGKTAPWGNTQGESLCGCFLLANCLPSTLLPYQKCHVWRYSTECRKVQLYRPVHMPQSTGFLGFSLIVSAKPCRPFFQNRKRERENELQLHYNPSAFFLHIDWQRLEASCMRQWDWLRTRLPDRPCPTLWVACHLAGPFLKYHPMQKWKGHSCQKGPSWWWCLSLEFPSLGA